MTSGSLGLRLGSYGSLQLLPIQTTPPLAAATARKPPKMSKEKERLFHWICKLAPRKKVGMLLLCVVSAFVFARVLYVGKGEDAPISYLVSDNTSDLTYPGSSPTNRDNTSDLIYPGSSPTNRDNTSDLSYPGSSPTNRDIDNFEEFKSSAVKERSSNGSSNGRIIAQILPPAYFTGYTLPPGNPCESFALPPPPADKKRIGPRPCPVCYLSAEEAIALMPEAPSFSPVLKNLTFIHEENLSRSEFGGSDFGGYPSLKQRTDSYDIRESMNVHCGFVRGSKPGLQSGFDIDDSDLIEMEQCQGVVVASAIFGAYDLIQHPKNISETAKKNVCFYMFVDEKTEEFLRNSSDLDSSKRLGLWRIVVVHNLPYSDPRRNGKVPKLLLHRLFPSARYSIWIDGKLELVVDPYQILERFLWRKNASFAISRHYRRFDVFVEAEANKAAGKYDNASINFQVEFYKKEGLTPYSEAKLPIISDVPEGCVIIREHIPISNLFTCLWFNEVDRFTSRDQISFSTARDKVMSKTNWTINMFLDCERRNFVVQGYHRDVLKHWPPPSPPPPHVIAVLHPPPPFDKTQNKTSSEISMENTVITPIKKIPSKRGRDRKSSSRRNRKVAAGNRDSN